jgi:hypothetical protein
MYVYGNIFLYIISVCEDYRGGIMIKINRKTEYADSQRSYKVILDNNCLGHINGGEIKNFEVTQGNHTAYLKIDWCRSNKVDFYVLENAVIEFDCGNSMSGWRLLFGFIYITFLKNKYLWIKIK